MSNKKQGHVILKAISFAIVIVIIVLFVFASPWTLGPDVSGIERSFLMLAVMMVPSSLCYGFGIEAEKRIWKLFLTPLFFMTIAIIGVIMVLYLP